MRKQIKVAVLADVLNDHSGARAPIRIAQGLANLGYNSQELIRGEFIRNEYKVTFYASDLILDESVKSDLERRGIRVRIYSLGLPIIGRVIIALKLFLEFARERFDLFSIHFSSLHYLITSLLPTPKLRTYYGTQLDLGIPKRGGIWSLAPQRLLLSYIKLRELVELKLSDQLLTISDYLVKEGWDLYGVKMKNIYLGVDNLAGLENKSPKKDKTLRILSVSRIVPYKGFHTLIKAFIEINKEIREMRLDIVGSAPIPEYLEYLNSIKNKNVFIHLNLPNKDLAELYRSTDIYATADTWVPWSLTPLEASSFSIPLLGLDYGAMKEIIQHKKNGLLAQNEKEFGVYLKKLAQDQALRTEYGKNAALLVKRFDWSRTYQEYDRIIKGMAN